jgi:hypothetical protein
MLEIQPVHGADKTIFMRFKPIVAEDRKPSVHGADKTIFMRFKPIVAEDKENRA